jgi:hypothetical protein
MTTDKSGMTILGSNEIHRGGSRGGAPVATEYRVVIVLSISELDRIVRKAVSTGLAGRSAVEALRSASRSLAEASSALGAPGVLPRRGRVRPRVRGRRGTT